ncbi:MAG: GAF domain-containing protein, partial [Nitrospirota bacterium]
MDKNESEINRKAEEFLKVFRKGEEFTQELLKENERLRYGTVQLEDQVKALQRASEGPEIENLKDTISHLEEEKTALINRYKAVENENKDFAARYLEVEDENNNLANLYVASYQLHSTLDFTEVLTIVVEIIINLIGTDEFGVMLLDETTNELSFVASEGIVNIKNKRIKIGDGIIGNVAKTGENYFEQDLENYVATSDMHPIVCIPLKIKDYIIGVIAIFSLMEQKNKKLTKIDYELLSMLAGHSATAIFGSKLYSQSERKLTTIQGFIDLL